MTETETPKETLSQVFSTVNFAKFLIHFKFQKQPFADVFCKIGAHKNSAKLRGRYTCWSLFLISHTSPACKRNSVTGVCLSVNFAKFLKTYFLKNISRQLLLKFP